MQQTHPSAQRPPDLKAEPPDIREYGAKVDGPFQLAGKVLSEAEKLSLAKEYEGEFVSQRLKG